MSKNDTTQDDCVSLRKTMRKLQEERDMAVSVVSILHAALNDASSVVDAGENEDYAYQAELEAGNDLLDHMRHTGNSLAGVEGGGADAHPLPSKLLAFAQRISLLKKWGEPNENGEPFEPSDGVDDSHSCLMDLIDEARDLLEPKQPELTSYCQQVCGGGQCGTGSVCMHGIDPNTEMPAASKDALSVARIANIDMRSIVGDYDVPADVAEWRWIRSVASFAHRDNGTGPGVWEFVVNLALTLDNIPPRLAPVLDAARRESAAYALFHQG